jgi:long-chain fatty acid transport protein
MPGYQASIAATAYLANTSFTPRGGGTSVDAKPVRTIVPGFFATGRLTDRIAVGIGAYVPFGLGLAWPKDWTGRLYGIDSSLTVLDINPTVAVQLHPKFSIGAGVDVMRGAVEFTNGLPTSATDSARIGGGAWGVGGNLGLLYRVLPEQLHFAATYRSRVKLDFSGRAHFEVAEPVFTSQLFDQPGKATLTLPDQISLGVMYRPLPRLQIGLDGQLVLWSTYKDVPVVFSNPGTPAAGFHPDSHDIVNVRLGAEWTPPLDGLKLRAGFVFDPTPAPATGLSPSLPDSDTLNFCLGVGYHTQYIGADLGYMLVVFLPAKARNPSGFATPPQSEEGTYHTLAHLIGLSVTGRILSSSTAPPSR